MSETNEQIIKLRATLDEIFQKRGVFTQETYTQIIMTLYEKLRALQTTPEISRAPLLEKPDEIRLVTVMFIDIVNSTMMARMMDADDWKRTIGTAHQHVSRVVQRWGGVVGQYLGDGLLCFFGATHSQEDDAIRATYCAFSIHETIARNASKIFERDDMAFTVRIGMSTGRVVVGLFGDDDNKTLLALGTPTNLAARLQHIAQPGETLIDAQTFRRVRNHFVTEPRPVYEFKGFDYPIEYHAVLSRRTHRPAQLTSTQIAHIETAFVGRDTELIAMRHILERSQSDSQLSAVIITGEIGLGKSRLLQEILYTAADLACEQITLIGNYQKKTRSYGLLQELLTTRCNLKEDMPQSLIEQRIVDHIRETWPHPDAEATAHAMGFLAGLGFDNSPHVRSLRQRIPEHQRMSFAMIARWFRGLAESGPLLIAVDNLQWVDTESLGLLEYVAQELADCPTVLCAATRPEFMEEHPHYMESIANLHRWELAPLENEEVDAILAVIFEHIDHVPDTLPEQICNRAEGNPLFVEEFLYMMFDNGVIEQGESGEWRINLFMYSMLSSNLPSGLIALLQTRLDELSSTTRQVIQIASVIGPTFWPGALTQIIGSEDIVQRALNDLEARGIIQANAESDFDREREYRFRHTLHRDVVYSMLARHNREAYHHSIATWLTERVANRPEYLGILAEHYQHSQLHSEALKAYVSAARERFQRGLMGETLSLIEKGLDAARKVPRGEALPQVSLLWMIQGQVYDALDRYEESSAASETALMLLNEQADELVQEQKAIASRTLGTAYVSLGRYDEAFNILNRANSLIPDGSSGQQAAILRSFGTLFRARGQLNESLAYQQQAYHLAQENGDPRELARIMAALSKISLDRGDFATALSYCEIVLEMNRQDDNIYFQILDLRQMATIYRLLFAYDRALELCAEAEPLQARIRYQDSQLQTNRALCMIATGQQSQGLKMLRGLAAANSENAMTQHSLQLALMNGLALTGDYETCCGLATQFVEQVDPRNSLMRGRGLLWLGIAQNALQESSAEHTLQQALQSELEFGGRDAWLCYHALSKAVRDSTLAEKYHVHARDVLDAIAGTFYTRPDLQRTLRQHHGLRWLDDPSHTIILPAGKAQPSSS